MWTLWTPWTNTAPRMRLKQRLAGTVPYVVALLLLVLPATAAQAAGKVALVVGNGAYEHAAPLANPAADAMAVSAKLESLGFEVHTAVDATQTQLLDTLAGFNAALSGADAAVFYYSGHGLQLGQENYLLPIDIDVRNELSVRYGAIGISDILTDIERQADITIVVLDACRDNPFAEDLRRAAGDTRSVAVSRGLAPMRPSASGTIIAYAAAAGDVASDGTGEHSPYTEAFLEEIDRPGAEVGLIFRRIAGRVIETTGGDQRPELLVRLTSEFYFSAPELVEVATPPAASGTGDSETTEVAEATPETLPDTRTTQPPADEAASPIRLDRSDELSPARWGYDATLHPRPIYLPPAPWEAPAGQQRQEQGENGDVTTSQLLGPNDTWRIAILPRGDHDLARLPIGRSGTLSVRARSLPAEIDLAARLLDRDRNIISNWTTAPRPGGDFEMISDIARPGIYLLEVADGSSDAESPEGIDLALDFTPSPDLYEPNETMGAAREAALNDTRRHTILPRGDADWFALSAPVSGELVIEALDVPDNLDIAFRLLDGDRNIIMNWTRGPRTGGDTYAVADLPRPGTYFLEVRDGDNNERSVEPFTLRTTFTENVDVSEPHNLLSAAYPIAENSELDMTIFPRGDVDWLAVTVDQPGMLELEATRSPSNLDIAFRVLDGERNIIMNWLTAPRKGGQNYAFADFARPGTYFVEVRDGSNDDRSIDPFKLNTTFTPAPDQYEPNDSLSAARNLTPGGETAFTILPLGDHDWFRVSVDTPGELAIDIDEGPKDLDIHVRVLDADRNIVLNWVAPYAPGGLTEAIADLPRAGTYFLDIADGSSDARSVEHATLSTRFTPLLNAYEPNDSLGAATPVTLEGETFAHILPKGDGDWFRIEVPGPGSLDFTIDQVAEALDISVRVLDPDRNIIMNWVNAPRPGGVTTATTDFEKAGTYFFEIRDGGSDARSPQPFRITRAWRPAG